MTMTTKELLALANAATPGPWQAMNERDWDVLIGDIDGPDDGEMHYAAVAEIIQGSPRSRANAALIVAAVNALPALCAEVEALRKDAERYRWLREQPGSTWRRIGFNTWNDDPSVFPWRDDEIDAAKEPK